MSEQELAAENADQARAWDGDDGDNWVEEEDFYNNASRYLHPHLIEGAAITSADRVLDIGCGCGQTTRDAARAAAQGSAFGIDLSTRMIGRARERAAAEGLSNLRFERGDAQIYAFEPGGFDVAISRFGSTFFGDPVGAYTNIAKSMAPVGRLTMLCWRDLSRNEWVSKIREALAAGRSLPEPPPGVPSPFAFADPDRTRSILGEAGFTDIAFQPVDEPMYMGPDAAASFEAVQKLGVVRGMLHDLDQAARTHALQMLRQTVADHQTPNGVEFGTSCWLVRAVITR